MIAQMLLVTCTKRYLTTIVEEFSDHLTAIDGAALVLYGITNKEQVGFILIKWTTPIPAPFTERLRTDTDVIDYIPYDAALHA